MTQISPARCRKGHALTPDNVAIYGGSRRCKACQRRNSRNYYNKKTMQECDGIEFDLNPRSAEEIERVTLFLHKVIDIIDRVIDMESS